jgi:uncharacterized membrane protein
MQNKKIFNICDLNANPQEIKMEENAQSASSPVIDEQSKSARQITLVVYILQAASFFVGLTFIAAVIINYIKKEDVSGTWLESHFRWQIRTFWFSLLWGAIGLITIFVAIGFAVLIADGIWIIYRIIKGWLRMNDGKEMYS